MKRKELIKIGIEQALLDYNKWIENGGENWFYPLIEFYENDILISMIADGSCIPEVTSEPDWELTDKNSKWYEVDLKNIEHLNIKNMIENEQDFIEHIK